MQTACWAVSRRSFIAFVFSARSAFAQAISSISIIVPFPPGGPLDHVARAVMQAFAEFTAEPYTVTNRAGTNGSVGARLASTAPPDGRTWLFGPDSLVTVDPIFAVAEPKFDASRDLTVVATLGGFPSLLVVSKQLGPRTLSDLVAYARETELTFASAGVGSAGHLTMQYFGDLAGMKLRHLPYRGGAPAIADVISGQADAAFAAVPTVLDAVKAGKVFPLAVSTRERIAVLPEVATVAEQGFGAFDVSGAFFVFLPSGTSAEIVSVVAAQLHTLLVGSDLRQMLLDLGLTSMPMTPLEAEAWMRAKRERWTSLIALHDIMPE